MKVVLFCGGLGTRIREYSENIPKPMVPVGQQPILLHIMQYYSQYGHRDFVLCLGYKANVIKEYFLNANRWTNSDFVISNFGKQVEVLGEQPPDWQVALIDTGIWRNIGQRLMAVRHLVKDEEFFLANYSDGLTDAPLPEMIERFVKSDKIGCSIASSKRAVSWPTNTRVFGGPWIRCETGRCLRKWSSAEKCPGACSRSGR